MLTSRLTMSSLPPEASILCLVGSAFLFLVNGGLRAADIPRPLDIRVEPAGFGTASSADLTLLLQSLFEAEPRAWQAMTFLNHDGANESLAQHLETWQSRCPGNLRPFIHRLAALFAIRLP
jgi:hypothetical protein